MFPIISYGVTVLIVSLPSRFERDTMYQFIEKVLDHDNLPKADSIEFDFSTLTFIRPVGVTVLSNLIGKLQKHGAKVTFMSKKPNRTKKHCPIAFLDDSMFFKHYLNETLDNEASLRPTTLPLADVSYDKSYQYLDNAMIWLAGKLNLTKESLGDIRMCLEEVFNNIIDHSFEQNGHIFIQQYPSENKVMVAISDFGVGIPGAIQTQFPSVNDAEALEMAIKHGFTTKSTPKNRGAGLDNLLHNVVINNKGSIHIHSNGGILICNHNSKGPLVISQTSSGYYPGTLLEINFRTDFLEYIEEEYVWDY